MAKPSTRQGLIDYCLRQLGAPVLEINVDDDQIDDLVDDAIQYFNERHFDGVEKMYLKYKITQEDIDRGIGAQSSGVKTGDYWRSRYNYDCNVSWSCSNNIQFLRKFQLHSSSRFCNWS